MVKDGMKKLSHSLTPQNGDPPSDYQRLVGAKTPGKEKGDYFTDAVAESLAKGMHGKYDEERKQIAVKLRAQSKERESQETQRQKEDDDEDEEERLQKVRYSRYSLFEEALYQMRLTDQRQADRMDREGWAGFNEDGTLRPKSGIDPLLEKRLRQSAEAQGKKYSTEEEIDGENNWKDSKTEGAVAKQQPQNRDATQNKVERERHQPSQREASSVGDYFRNKDSSGRVRSPAKKTVTEAFGPLSSQGSSHCTTSESTTKNRETNFGEIISQAKGGASPAQPAPPAPQVPWSSKLQEIKQKSGEWAHKASHSLEKIGRRNSAESDMSFSCAGVPAGTNAGEGQRCASRGAEALSDGSKWEICKECRRK